MRPYVLCCLAAALALPSSAEAQVLSLWTASGTTSGQGFGHAVAGLGDVNGDGVPDVVVGGPTYSSGNPLFTQVRVLSGANGLTIYLLNGLPDEGFGFRAAAVGDLDADGIGDFALGSPGASPNGRVRAFSGGTGTSLFVVDGTTLGSGFGFSVSSAGDANADGVPDIVAGSNNLSPPTITEVQILSGAGGANLLTLTGGGSFGSSVSGAGDLNGDGKDDILVGAPFAGLYFVGQAFAFSGADGTLLHFFEGPAGSAMGLGQAVLGPGDLDGDGTPDIALGAWPFAGGVGAFRAHSGATGALLYEVPGMFGSLASLGDVDGDGRAEIVTGAPPPGYSVAYPAGGVRILSGATGATFLDLAPPPGTSGLGTAIGLAGDLNADGIPDLVFGDPSANPALVSGSGEATAVSFVGMPAGTSGFGVGCAGSGGFVPLLQTAGGVPTVGNAAFKAVLSKALGGTTAVLVAGFSSTTWLGLPLPFNLGFLGLPNCSLHVSADQFLTVFTSGAGPGTGTAFAPIPIAPAPALAGTTSYFQWYVVDPGPLALPGAMSPALQVTVQ